MRIRSAFKDAHTGFRDGDLGERYQNLSLRLA